MTKEVSTKIVDSMTPGAEGLLLGRDHMSYIVEMPYFFKNLFLFVQAYIRQTGSIVIMIMDGSTKI